MQSVSRASRQWCEQQCAPPLRSLARGARSNVNNIRYNEVSVFVCVCVCWCVQDNVRVIYIRFYYAFCRRRRRYSVDHREVERVRKRTDSGNAPDSRLTVFGGRSGPEILPLS